MRPQRIALEDHARVAFVGRKVRNIHVADPNGAAVRDTEARDTAKQGGLAATAWAEEEEEFAGFDEEGHVIHCASGAEGFVQFIDLD